MYHSMYGYSLFHTIGKKPLFPTRFMPSPSKDEVLFALLGASPPPSPGSCVRSTSGFDSFEGLRSRFLSLLPGQRTGRLQETFS